MQLEARLVADFYPLGTIHCIAPPTPPPPKFTIPIGYSACKIDDFFYKLSSLKSVTYYLVDVGSALFLLFNFIFVVIQSQQEFK